MSFLNSLMGSAPNLVVTTLLAAFLIGIGRYDVTVGTQ
jgi:hypothetical protein